MTSTRETKPIEFKKNIVTCTLIAASMLGTSMLAVAASDDPMAAPNTVASKASAAASKTERVVSDSWITTKVKSEILANSISKGFKVGVTTKHGVVALDGKLPNQDAIDLVKTIAEKVKGVKSVDTSALVVGG